MVVAMVRVSSTVVGITRLWYGSQSNSDQWPKIRSIPEIDKFRQRILK